MTTSGIQLCAIPKPLWEDDGEWGGSLFSLSSFIEDALGIERRLRKGINLENERTRYHLACLRLESSIPQDKLIAVNNAETFYLALKNFRFPSIYLNAGYLDALNTLVSSVPDVAGTNRFAASFFPPEDLDVHNRLFENACKKLALSEEKNISKRVKFFNYAHKANCGILTIFNPFNFDHPTDHKKEEMIKAEVLSSNKIVKTLYAVKDSYVDNKGLNLYQILRREIGKALKVSESGEVGEVNFSNQPHNVITEVLHDFVYYSGEEYQNPILIKVIYNDGSQGPLFPLKCVPSRKKQLDSNVPTIRIALMSMRHLDMDHDVDMAWLRNREVSKSRSLGETDLFCFEQSKKQLAQIFDEGKLKIFLYHTGFQPAILGLYRAFVETLLERKVENPKIEIIPQYHHRRRGYISGKPWI